jgi:hypothetical protein
MKEAILPASFQRASELYCSRVAVRRTTRALQTRGRRASHREVGTEIRFSAF